MAQSSLIALVAFIFVVFSATVFGAMLLQRRRWFAIAAFALVSLPIAGVLGLWVESVQLRERAAWRLEEYRDREPRVTYTMLGPFTTGCTIDFGVIGRDGLARTESSMTGVDYLMGVGAWTLWHGLAAAVARATLGVRAMRKRKAKGADGSVEV